MYKFFLNQEDIVRETEISIRHLDSVRHLQKSLRINTGEEISICTPSVVYLGKVTAVSDEEILLDIVEKTAPENESPVQIDIFQCLPKGQKLELIIQKNVELGVRDFYLVTSKRCIVDFKDKDIGKKLDRYNKIALEAAKQSKRDYISEVKGVLKLTELPLCFSDYDLVIMLYEGESQNYLNHVLVEMTYKNIAVIIGPEGGFDQAEVQLLLDGGAKIVTLGKRILRTETAGMACVACLQYAVGDLSS